MVEQPPGSLGTFNDMWFSWIIDGGFPGPDRGDGGKYRLVPPGYDGPLPDGGFFVAKSKTNRVLYAFRAFLVNNDPKPTVQNIKKTLKIYPCTPGGYGTSIGTALEGKVRLGRNPAVPATKFVDATGKAFNTVPPSDYAFFGMINENVQQEPATSYDVELAGQLAAIGIVKGKPFNPDARMKKILSDAAAVGNASGRMLNFRYAVAHPDWAYNPGSKWGQHAMGRRRLLRDAAPGVHPGGDVQAHAVPARAFWSFTLYDNQTRSMLDTPQRYPRAGSQTYPSPAAEPNADGSTTVYFGPRQPDGVKRGNWIQTIPGKGWFTILRLHSPLEPFFTKQWRLSEIEALR